MNLRAKSILVYDATETGFLGKSWATGGRLFRGSFDEVVAAKSVDEFYAALRNRAPSSLKHVQFWGHGAPGAPLINRKPIQVSDPSWTAVVGGTVWFRTCDVMRGIDGCSFAEGFAFRKIDVAGHLGIIGTWGMHSHLVGLLHEDKTPWWSNTAKVGDSTPWAPRTVSALTMRLPEWAFSPSRRK